MKTINRSTVAIAAGLLGAPLFAQAQTSYDYQVIDYPGAPATELFGISDRGQVVGNGYSDPDSFPFVYAAKKGTFTDVAPVAGYSSTGLIGLSDSGAATGSVVSLDLSTTMGLIRQKDGTYTIFSHPDAVTLTQGRGINNKGLVAGFRDATDSQLYGFIYDPKADTYTDIVPSLFTIAHGINARGDVVGSAIYDTSDEPCDAGLPPGIVTYGWLRSADGAVTWFDVNGQSTRARGITDSGTIAGFVNTPDGTIQGFVVELDGSQCQSIGVASGDLLSVPGFDSTLPEGISNSGTVVGNVFDADGNQHGFIATP